MDSNNVVIKYLGTLGYNPSTSYYGYIELWKEWYENFVPKFHEYHDQNGDKRELYKLGSHSDYFNAITSSTSSKRNMMLQFRYAKQILEELEN